MFKFKKFVIRCRAIIFYEGKLLVVKHPHDTSFAVLPGGKLEWQEGIKEALSREITEELGITPEVGRLMYINNFIDRNKEQSVEFFFEVLNSGEYKDMKNISKGTHAYEIAEILWIRPTDIVSILPKTIEKDFRQGKIISDQVRFINNK